MTDFDLPDHIQEPAARAIAVGDEVWSGDWNPARLSTAPGRIELLGNHLDYNGGPVLAGAIDRVAVAAWSPGAKPGVIEIAFADLGDTEPIILEVDSLRGWQNPGEKQQPVHYAKGAIAALIERGLQPRSGRIVLSSSVPMGVGVSSSAAICVALCNAMLEEPVSNTDLVLLAQNAEHRSGTPCGTMDQSASVHGGVIRFDGADLSVRTMHPNLGSCAFLVIDSGVKRSLATSSYGTRVEECRAAVTMANELLGTTYVHLAQITPPTFERLEALATDPSQATLLKRVKHVATETGRVGRGEQAMLAGNWSQFGALMTAGGRSSARDYQISHPVVERLVRDIEPVPGVLGVRMMGGGEGGSVLALVDSAIAPDVIERLRTQVREGGYGSPESEAVYAVVFAPGAAIY